MIQFDSVGFTWIQLESTGFNQIQFTVPAKMSYKKRYVPSKWLLDFDKYGYGGHVDIK